MRSRIVKPSFFVNEKLAECGPYAMLLFEGLWCAADRAGRLEDRPARLKVQILPYFEVDIEQLLGQLEEHGFITRYEVEGNRYIQVATFSKHQKPHVREAESAIPAELNSATTLAVPRHSLGSPVTQVHENLESKPIEKEKEQEVVALNLNLQEGDARGNQNGNGVCTAPTHLQLEIEPQEPGLTPEELVAAWNQICVPAGLREVKSLSSDRRRKVLARIGESRRHARAVGESVDDFWSYVLSKIADSPFCRNLRPRPGHEHWKADFDWMIGNDTTFLKIREGKYD